MASSVEEATMILGWVDLGIGIFLLLVKYGPTLVKLASDVYEQIEKYSKAKQTEPSSPVFDGKKATSKDKRLRFDTLLKALASLERGKDLNPGEISDLRETIWKIKNFRKQGKTR